MLTSLQVRNFAIIDQAEVEFSSGMTVLTGETGAGKSILVDALGLVLGNVAVPGLRAAVRSALSSPPNSTCRTCQARGFGSRNKCWTSTTNAISGA